MVEEPWKTFRDSFYAFMSDDFGTAGALSVLFDAVKKINPLLEKPDSDFSQPLGLFHELGEEILGLKFESDDSGSGKMENELIELVVSLRKTFKENKEWEMSDRIRDTLKEAGIILEDGPEGTRWRKG